MIGAQIDIGLELIGSFFRNRKKAAEEEEDGKDSLNEDSRRRIQLMRY